MNKKPILIISILAITLLLFIGYKNFLGPKGVEGNKEVSIHIVNEDQNVDEIFTYNTDHEFLLDLLKENQKQLGIKFEESSYGTMIIGMMDYVANPSKQEFFYLTINGEEAMTGAGEVTLIDQDVYKFELTNY